MADRASGLPDCPVTELRFNMNCRFFHTALVFLAGLPLVACTHAFQLRAPLVATPDGFSYRSDCPGYCDLHSPDAEEARLRNLGMALRQARMCPNGYLIVQRSSHGVTLHSVPTIVNYEGHCR